MANIKMKTGDLEDKLKFISFEMEKGSIDALYEMKKLLDENDYNWVEASGQIEPKVFSVMWVLNAVIAELWSNLGPDSSGFPKKEGSPYIVAISKNLGKFAQQALFMEYEEDRGSLCVAATKVFELFRVVNDRLMKEGVKPEESCVL
jgi:hypothetical protein